MANILVFLHSNYLLHSAGVEKVVLEQQGIFCDHGYDFFAICPVSRVKLILGQHVPLRTELYIIIKNGQEERRCDFYNLQKFLLQNIWHAIIIHHLKNYNHTTLFLEILKTLSKTVPVFFYIHDYATICYNHLLMKNGKYCSNKSIGPSLLKCYNCKFYIFSIFNKIFYKKLFKQINFFRIIFPSEIIYQIWRKVYSDIEATQCMVLPHQRFSNNTIENKHCIDYRIKIAYVGYASPEKGWDFWKDIVKNISESLIYTPYILGKSREQIPNVIQHEVSFLKEGNNAMVNALRNNRIDIAVLWSRRPETYSYTTESEDRVQLSSQK